MAGNFDREILRLIFFTVLEEEPEPFEGDIELTPETKDEVDMSEEGDIDGPLKPRAHAKRGVANHRRDMLWPGGVVPYEIDLSTLSKKTCL